MQSNEQARKLQKLAQQIAQTALQFAEDVEITDFGVQHYPLAQMAESFELELVVMSEAIDRACKGLDVILERTL